MPTDPTRTDAASSGDGAAPQASVPHGVDGPDAPLSGDGGPAETPGAAPRRRGPVRRAGRVLAFLGLGLVLLVAGVLIFLQTSAGRSLARGLVVQQIANVFADDVEVSAETLAGSFLSGARLTGLAIRRDGEMVVAVDTVIVDYNLTTLLRRTFSASDLMVSGARVVARQRADSTFNMAGLLKPADPDKGPSDFGVRLDRVIVRRSQADVIWYRAEGIQDSVHSVRDLNAVVTGFRQRADSLSGSIEALSLRALAPLDRGEAILTAAGDFSKRDLSLTSLAVRSTAGTDLRGRARLQFTGDGALPVFEEIGTSFGLPVLTDVHTEEQCREVASVVDILQIPAFLCRQTDLLVAAAETGRVINIKKGQFLAPWDMENVAAKVASTGNGNILLCERGASFGYNMLVSDMRSLPIMAKTGYPVVFDATHSVQLPGGMGGSSGGQREFVEPLARAAMAVGTAAVFIETHEDPDNAPSDGPNMVQVDGLANLLKGLAAIDDLTKGL